MNSSRGRRSFGATFGPLAVSLGGRWRTLPIGMVDQALLGLGNLAMTILLARALGPVAFSVFTVAFSMAALVASLLAAVLTEPVGVLGARKSAAALPAYGRRLLRLNLLVAGLCLLPVLGSGLVLLAWSPSIGLVLIAAAVFVPLARIQWLGRKLCALRGAAGRSAWSSAAYLAAGAGAAVGFAQAAPGEAFVGFAAQSAACLAAALVLLAGIPRAPARGLRRDLAVLRQHWRYGRWILFSSLGAWVTNWLPYPLLAAFWGATAAGHLRVAQTIMMPLAQFAAAVAAVGQPALTRVRLAGRTGAAEARALCALLGVTGLVYACGALAFGGPLLGWAFGAAYLESIALLPWVALAAVSEAVKLAPEMLLMAHERTRLLFRARMVGVLLMVGAGVPLIVLLGAPGAGMSLALVAFGVGVAGLLAARQVLRPTESTSAGTRR